MFEFIEKVENVAKMCSSIDAIEANAIKFIFSDHATSGSLGLSSIKVNLVFFFLICFLS